MVRYLILLTTLGLTACSVPGQNMADISAEEARQRRARVQALDNEDYAIARQRRQDAIEDYGRMRQHDAEATKKATENISKQPIILR